MSDITYHGFVDFEGRPNIVFIVDGDTPTGELQGGPFSWGKGLDENRANPLARAAVATGGRNLAVALCTHLLNGRDDMAKVVATRFQHRKITELTTAKGFVLRRSDMLALVQQIVTDGAGNAEIARAVDQEMAPVATERGALAGSPVSEIERRAIGGVQGIPVSKLKDSDL